MAESRNPAAPPPRAGFAAKSALPLWTWVLPALIFHFGTGLSLNFTITPGVSLWYFPIPLGIILVHWWGPRALVGLYLNALVCAGYWGLYRWWLWPLYALPETIKVGLSWWLFARLAKGKCWLPDLSNTAKFLVLGIVVPSCAASTLSQLQFLALGDVPSGGNFWVNVFSESVLDIMSPFALSIPALLFATAPMERLGLTLTQGASPRPALLLGAVFTPVRRLEAAALFAALLIAGLTLSVETSWYVFGALLLWAAIRFGIGMATVAGVCTIVLALLVPAFLGSGPVSETQSMVRANLNLAVMCFAALIAGRALSDTRQEIDTRKEAERRLRLAAESLGENEAKYRTLFESASDGVFLAQDGVILECNKYSLELFRCEPAYLIGRPIAEISPDRQPDGSTSSELARENRSKAVAGRPQRFEWRYLRADGSVFDGEVSLTQMELGGGVKHMAVIRDVTERKMVERALVESEERFRQMADNMEEIFFLMDIATESMLYVSPVAEKIMGLPISEIRGRPLSLYERIHPDDAERLGFRNDAGWRFGAFNEDYRFARPDGKTIWLRLRTFLIRDPRGEPYRVAGIISEITEYKNAQEEARTRQRQLMQADKMNSLGLMVSGVAHEINNPNNLIMLNADVLETFWKHIRPVLRGHARTEPEWKLAGLAYDNAEGKLETLLAGIAGGAKRIKRIVDNLKDFARVDAGGMTESIAVDQVIDASVSIVENMIRKATDRFTIDHGQNLPRINGNFQKLEQVIINLITNACQALDERGKSIVIATRHDAEGGEVVISVKDEGRGIPGELIGKVADPFFTTKRDSGGTGLGLSVSYGIVQEHRGSMKLTSEAGRGTEVEIRIPARAGRALEAKDV